MTEDDEQEYTPTQEELDAFNAEYDAVPRYCIVTLTLTGEWKPYGQLAYDDLAEAEAEIVKMKKLGFLDPLKVHENWPRGPD